MTKHIRIENADTSTYKVKVLVQTCKDWAPEKEGLEWITEREIFLNTPTQMITETLWKGKRLIIEENE